MKLWTLPWLVLLVAAPCLGCRVNGARELVERDLRWQEDEIDHLQGHLTESKQRLAACRKENASLRKRLAEKANAARASSGAGSKKSARDLDEDDLGPVEVDLPDEQAPPFGGPPEISAPDRNRPDGELPGDKENGSDKPKPPSDPGGELPALEGDDDSTDRETTDDDPPNTRTDRGSRATDAAGDDADTDPDVEIDDEARDASDSSDESSADAPDSDEAVPTPKGTSPFGDQSDAPEAGPSEPEELRLKKKTKAESGASSPKTKDGADSTSDEAVQRITLNRRLTGALNLDRERGSEGVMVVIEPRDAKGNILHVPGDIAVVVLDPHAVGDAARVARWDFSAADAGDQLRKTTPGEGLHFQLLWPGEPPAHSDLNLYVRYTTADGRKLEEERPFQAIIQPQVREQWTGSTRTPRSAPVSTPRGAAASGRRSQSNGSRPGAWNRSRGNGARPSRAARGAGRLSEAPSFRPADPRSGHVRHAASPGRARPWAPER